MNTEARKKPLPDKPARILIFIVAYNAETTLTSVLNRIPEELTQHEVEVLVIDDFSQDKTFQVGLGYQTSDVKFALKVLRTPFNQGYGGNQKLGYRYAIEHQFDFVVLLHGDGQYAPEAMPDLLDPLLEGKAEAVFGSRMMRKGAARKGGMPLYKWVGNQILTAFQNLMLSTQLSEFHSGYRVYAVEALKKIPFERNSNDFHFDTQIIIQLVLRQLRIVEVPIPTYYGSEICYVNGMKYAWDVFRTTLRSRFHQMNLFYDRKFDIAPPEEKYSLKLGFTSSHTLAINAVQSGANLLDIGCGQGYVARYFLKKDCRVTALDQYAPTEEQGNTGKGIHFIRCDLDAKKFPFDVSSFDQVLMLDVIEHLKDPEGFMEELRFATGGKRPELILTTANIGFLVMRIMLLLGQFNYGKKGILDLTHTRLFTFASLRALLEQCGYRVLEMRGIPAPFPEVIGLNFAGRFLIAVNQLLIRLSPGLFSYQIFVLAEALPSVKNLLEQTIANSKKIRETVAQERL